MGLLAAIILGLLFGAGYDGYSMSNNARQAYAEGKFPISKLTKKMLEDSGLARFVTVKEAKALAKSGAWDWDEWHHTSKEYNKTNFYSLSGLAHALETHGRRGDALEPIPPVSGPSALMPEEAKADLTEKLTAARKLTDWEAKEYLFTNDGNFYTPASYAGMLRRRGEYVPRGGGLKGLSLAFDAANGVEDGKAELIGIDSIEEILDELKAGRIPDEARVDAAVAEAARAEAVRADIEQRVRRGDAIEVELLDPEQLSVYREIEAREQEIKARRQARDAEDDVEFLEHVVQHGRDPSRVGKDWDMGKLRARAARDRIPDAVIEGARAQWVADAPDARGRMRRKRMLADEEAYAAAKARIPDDMIERAKPHERGRLRDERVAYAAAQTERLLDARLDEEERAEARLYDEERAEAERALAEERAEAARAMAAEAKARAGRLNKIRPDDMPAIMYIHDVSRRWADVESRFPEEIARLRSLGMIRKTNTGNAQLHFALNELPFRPVRVFIADGGIELEYDVQSRRFVGAARRVDAPDGSFRVAYGAAPDAEPAARYRNKPGYAPPAKRHRATHGGSTLVISETGNVWVEAPKGGRAANAKPAERMPAERMPVMARLPRL